VLTDMRETLVGASEALRGAVERALLDARARIGRLVQDVSRSAQRATERRRAQVELLGARLDALSPLATLARGYAVARGANGQSLSTARDFVPGEPFTLVVRDGDIAARTESVTPHLEHLEPPEHPPQ
jgi:exodeoxyribonuclease VII large subunit